MSRKVTYTLIKPDGVEWFGVAYPEKIKVIHQYELEKLGNLLLFSWTMIDANSNTQECVNVYPDEAAEIEFEQGLRSLPEGQDRISYNSENNIIITETVN